jgi:maltooligosyltrehalose trehalohydrolase
MSETSNNPSDRTIGARPVQDGVRFRVWAPKRRRVAVVIEAVAPVDLMPEGDGYFGGTVSKAKAGDRYQFQLDGEAKLRPDPASRFQPDGVHGPSQIVDPKTFRWTDQAWQGVTAHGQVLYEMHIGCFTTEGTYAAAIAKLPHLKDLGVTCIEMMPIAEFAGRWNWGYDGVGLFAPTHNYGTPDDLRRFVDAAHAIGIGVILDVVYNHFGPDGNYLGEFSDHYLSDKHPNDWGQGINFDGDQSRAVREFYLANTRYWIEDFHFDGFRFDATQAIFDDSQSHILAEIARAAREAAGRRSIYLINENEPQDTKLVRPAASGGIGMDALWNDDFHHSARVALTGRRDAYFTDYKGTPQELLSAIKWGYLYQGQIYKWQEKRRGTPALDLPPTAFVNYIQNHDQIANYAFGGRIQRYTSDTHLRALTALMLLAPQTPMLFMGQEWAATAPFLFFSDHCGELPQLVAKGRKREMSQFPSVGGPETLERLPDPCAPATFERCKLDWQERENDRHQQWLALHRDLLALRRDDPIFSHMQRNGAVDGSILGKWSLAVRYFGEVGTKTSSEDRLLLINLGVDEHFDVMSEPLLAPPLGKRWMVLLSTEDPKYGGVGFVPPETRDERWRLPGENWRLLGRCTTVLKPVPEQEPPLKDRGVPKHAKVE